DLEKSDACVSSDRQQARPDRLEVGGEFGQSARYVGRGEFPELIKLLADKRPALHAGRRRGQRHLRQIEVVVDRSHAVDQPKDEPSRRSDYKQQAEQRDHGGGETRTSAEPEGYPFEGGIERDREHHAPDADGDKRKQQDDAGVEEKPERGNAEYRLDRERGSGIGRRTVLLISRTIAH